MPQDDKRFTQLDIDEFKALEPEKVSELPLQEAMYRAQQITMLNPDAVKLLAFVVANYFGGELRINRTALQEPLELAGEVDLVNDQLVIRCRTPYVAAGSSSGGWATAIDQVASNRESYRIPPGSGVTLSKAQMEYAQERYRYLSPNDAWAEYAKDIKNRFR